MYDIYVRYFSLCVVFIGLCKGCIGFVCVCVYICILRMYVLCVIMLYMCCLYGLLRRVYRVCVCCVVLCVFAQMNLCWNVLLRWLLSLSQIYCFNLFWFFVPKSCICSGLPQFEPACGA